MRTPPTTFMQLLRSLEIPMAHVIDTLVPDLFPSLEGVVRLRQTTVVDRFPSPSPGTYHPWYMPLRVSDCHFPISVLYTDFHFPISVLPISILHISVFRRPRGIYGLGADLAARWPADAA